MIQVREPSAVEAWLQWFETHKYTQCRAYLCATYGLEASDADALINTARMQVFLHWETIQNPLAYFWTILRREVQKHLRGLTRERLRQEAYVLQRRAQDRIEERTAHHVADILSRVPPHQSQLLWWFVHGYDDAQVAVRRGTTPHAVRQARYATYVDLRKQGEGHV
jgi:DNA-directed RNA polymerase specialized sigma24 family protein